MTNGNLEMFSEVGEETYVDAIEKAKSRELNALFAANTERCPFCNWTFAETEKDGCVVGNCSMRGR